MVLALLKAEPLPSGAPDNTQLITPLPVNGRRFLRDEFANKQYGSCQAGAVVEFPNLQTWVVDERDTDAVKAILERGCRHVKEGYDYWLDKDFQVAVNVSKDHFLASSLSGYAPCVPCTNLLDLTTLTSSSPPGLHPLSRIQTFQSVSILSHFSTNQPTQDSNPPQVFISDGLVDRYIPHKVLSPSGQQVLNVQSCVFLLDTYLPDMSVFTPLTIAINPPDAKPN